MTGHHDRPDGELFRSDEIVLTISWVGDSAIVTVAGVLDMVTSPHLVSAVHGMLRHRPAAILIDLTPTEFLASAGMSALIRAHRTAAPTAVVVVADGPVTRRPIELMGIDELVQLRPTVEAALASITG